jgi:hypothetical protein
VLDSGHPTLAIYASDKGPGDAERATIMSQAGNYLARKGARLICLAENDDCPVPLITAARAGGGEVVIIADEGFVPPPTLADVPCERIADAEGRLARMAALADVFVGLPGSLASTKSLYLSWVRAGAGVGGKPVVLFNRNQAFDAMWGFAADIFSHSIKRHDRYVQFADSVEDMWNKIIWLLSDARPRK